MKKILVLLTLIFTLTLISMQTNAQCSICTKTAEQLGEKPGKGLNAGILYLALTPLTIAGFLGYKWWRKERTIKD
jgi:hypothetical protein